MNLAFAPERIETWPLERLQPYARNAKTHGPDQVAKLATDIAEFGWTVPWLVAEDGELIDGHGRGRARRGSGGVKQSRIMSMVEAAANVAVGYVLAIATQIFVFPWFAIETGLTEQLSIGLALVGVSLARWYLLRRLFERLHRG